jgi:hypothetical protein
MNNTTFSQEDAIKVLIKSVNVAQQRGAYNLVEAATIHKAVSVFLTKADDSATTTQTGKQTDSSSETKKDTNAPVNSIDVTKNV